MKTKLEEANKLKKYNKELYSHLKIREKRDAFFIGTNENNIGGAICEHFIKNNYNCHITDKSDMDVFLSPVLNFLDRKFDILILNNGETHLDWIENQPYKKIHSVINNNLTGSIFAIQSYVNLTINDPWIKTIIIIGSMAYSSVLNGSSVYCAAKAGLNHFSKCVAWELAPKGYRIFIVNPSNVQSSPMSEATIKGLMSYRNLTRPQAESYWSDCCPLYNFLEKDEIAELCLSLTKDSYKYLSGSSIDLKGSQR